jgi:Protein of unknown function (DUF3126)
MSPSEITKLQAYLHKTLGTRSLVVRADPKNAASGEVLLGERPFAKIEVDTEDGDTTYQIEWKIKEKPQPLSAQELVRIQTYLREQLGAKTLSVRARGRIKDSAEVFVGEESIALVNLDNDGYQVQMAILDMDLDELG